jgi:hypothetical protein
MPQRPPSFAERLRSALGTDAESTTTATRPELTRETTGYKGTEFADRLAAALRARR